MWGLEPAQRSFPNPSSAHPPSPSRGFPSLMPFFFSFTIILFILIRYNKSSVMTGGENEETRRARSSFKALRRSTRLPLRHPGDYSALGCKEDGVDGGSPPSPPPHQTCRSRPDRVLPPPPPPPKGRSTGAALRSAGGGPRCGAVQVERPQRPPPPERHSALRAPRTARSGAARREVIGRGGRTEAGKVRARIAGVPGGSCHL